MEYSVEYYESVVMGFEALWGALMVLCRHINDDLVDLPVWVESGEGGFLEGKDARHKLIRVLQHFSPMHSLTRHETFSCPGAVGSTLKTLALINEVNQKKDAFREIVKSGVGLFDKANPTKPARRALAVAGHGAVKLKQVYRHLPAIDFHPRRIAWSKSKISSHRVINTVKAREMVAKTAEDDYREQQLSLINLLQPHDKLVIYYAIQSHWGANIATFKNAERRSTTHKMWISLPIFYLHDEKLPLPMVEFSNKNNRQENAPRSDKLLEKEPFLKSIKAYRYK